MRISDWSSDVCSSDLYLYPNAYLSSASAALLAPTPDGRLFISGRRNQRTRLRTLEIIQNEAPKHPSTAIAGIGDDLGELRIDARSEEHTSELQSLMRISYAVCFLKKKNKRKKQNK